MTHPSWLNSPDVKVYAAEHLPVLRVQNGELFYLVWTGKGDTDFVKVARESQEGVLAAWERLQDEWLGDLGNTRPPSVLGGFYYLEPGYRQPPPHVVLPPTLVPCEDVTEIVRLCLTDEKYPTTPTRIVKAGNHAALVFHREARICKSGDEHHGAMLPELIHVETRDGEK